MSKPTPQFLTQRSVLALAVTTLVTLSACALPERVPQRRGTEVAVLEGTGLSELNPSDVAVAPVIIYMLEANQQLRDAVPVLGLRQAMQRALVRRRYSPLALDFVDSRVVDASYTAGSVGEQAMCEVIVHAWSERYWKTDRVLDVDVEVRMLDPMAEAESLPLWAGRMKGEVEVNSITNYRAEARLREDILDEIALELLARMPARDTSPGQQ
jgi:hypothetical protein